MDGQTEFIPILQDFVPCRDRRPKKVGMRKSRRRRRKKIWKFSTELGVMLGCSGKKEIGGEIEAKIRQGGKETVEHCKYNESLEKTHGFQNT